MEIIELNSEEDINNFFKSDSKSIKKIDKNLDSNLDNLIDSLFNNKDIDLGGRIEKYFKNKELKIFNMNLSEIKNIFEIIVYIGMTIMMIIILITTIVQKYDLISHFIVKIKNKISSYSRKLMIQN